MRYEILKPDSKISLNRILILLRQCYYTVTTFLECFLLVDPFDPTELVDGMRQLYKTREGWLSPFPWCEEFHFQLDNIYTRLKVIGRKKARGTATGEIVNMSAIFKPHEECSNPRTVLIEGSLMWEKQRTARNLFTTWLRESQ